MSIVNDNGVLEPLFYSYSENKDNNISSDSNSIYSFEELQDIWSEYSILTKEGQQFENYNINSIINPVFGFLHYENNLQNIQNELVYLVYPNKFICNKTLTNFIVEYEHTYI